MANQVNSDEHQRWSSASIRVFGETLRPEDVGAALGLQATRMHHKGELRGRDHKVVWRESAWLIKSPLGKDRDLPEHLDWLLNAVEPKLDVIRSLSEKYRVDLFC